MKYKIIKNEKRNGIYFDITILNNNKKDEKLSMFFNTTVYENLDRIKKGVIKVLKGEEKEINFMFNETLITINSKITKIQECEFDNNKFLIDFVVDTKKLYKLILKYEKMRNVEKNKKNKQHSFYNTNKKIKEIYNCKPDYTNENEISPLGKWYNKLIDKTIAEITEDDVEKMIRQNILLELALKKAIEFLNIDIFAGALYTAGILIHVSKLDISYLRIYSKELKCISLSALNKLEKNEFIEDNEEKKEIQEAIHTMLDKISVNNNKSKLLILGISLLFFIVLFIVALNITISDHGYFESLCILLLALFSYILCSKIFVKKEKKIYKLRFFFDYCAFSCLWAGDQLTDKKYGCLITDFKKLGLSNSTIKEIKKLSKLFDTSLNWSDPGHGDEPWDKQQWNDFDEQAQRLFEKISKELPKNFKLVNKYSPHILNLDQICEKLIETIPEQQPNLKNSIEENNGELLGHIYFGNEFNNHLINLLKNYMEIEKIKKYCNFIEYMWKIGDSSVVNIVNVTILERLSDDQIVWNNFGRNISNEFKEYINNELIPNNVLMNHVNKL